MIHCSAVVKKVLVLFSILMLSAAGVFAADSQTDWGTGTIRVTGAGIPPAYTVSPVQARLMARRAAQADAQRQLLETVNGVQVDADTTVENMMLTSDVIHTHVNGIIRGARIVDEKYADGAYFVTMEISMFGASNSIASAVFDKAAPVESFPKPVAAVEPSVPSVSVTVDVTPGVPSLPKAPADTVVPAVSGGKAMGNVTGLIVDCRGLGLKPVMSPVIKNADGTPIYGHKNLDSKFVIANGMASYSSDPGNTSRAGSNPLLVRAVSLDNHNSYPVLSVADANLVLMENNATGFLDKTNVVFLR